MKFEGCIEWKLLFGEVIDYTDDRQPQSQAPMTIIQQGPMTQEEAELFRENERRSRREGGVSVSSLSGISTDSHM